jgi:hypothetical protein
VIGVSTLAHHLQPGLIDRRPYGTRLNSPHGQHAVTIEQMAVKGSDEALSWCFIAACHSCNARLIGRDWYDLTLWSLMADGRCTACGTPCAGVFEGLPKTWDDDNAS